LIVLQADYAPHFYHSALQFSIIYCPFRALTVFAITRRVAAGRLVLPFQGERMTVTIDRHPQTENTPHSGLLLIQFGKIPTIRFDVSLASAEWQSLWIFTNRYNDYCIS
jgi:hypothetical protein